MTTSQSNSQPIIRSEQQIQQDAWRAVQRFKQMEPTLVAFARAVTGNPKVRIQATSSEGSSSTRDLIHLHLPIDFGTNRKHDTRLCYDRGPDMIQLCPACKIMENVQYDFFHECSHIGMGSHDPINSGHVTYAAKKVYDTWRPMFPKFATAKSDEIRRTRIDPWGGMMPVAGIVHNWLPFVFNVIEDIRVDTRMFEIREGLRDMSAAVLMQLMREGQMIDNEQKFWRDAPLEKQILVAIIFYYMGHSMEYFSDECQQFILNNEVLKDFYDRAVSATGVDDAFGIACELLYYLHTLGMYDPPLEEDQDEDPANQSDQQDQSTDPKDSQSGEGGGGDGDEQGSPDKEEGSGGGRGEDAEDGDKSGDGVSPDGDDDESAGEGGQRGRGDIGNHNHPEEDGEEQDGTGDDTGLPDPSKLMEALAKAGGRGDPSDPNTRPIEEAIDQALVQAMFFDDGSMRVHGVRTHERGRTNPGKDTYRSAWATERPYSHYEKPDLSEVKPSEAVIGSTLIAARRAFSDNIAVKRDRNKRSGRVNARSLARRAPFNDDRMFEKKDRPNNRKYFVEVMIDVSGSNNSNYGIERARSMAGAIGELLGRLGGVKFEMTAHTADYVTGNESLTYNKMLALDLYPLKKIDEPWGSDCYDRIRDLVPSQGNIDGHALEWARKRCDAQPRGTHNIILYETDGQMPATNGREEREILEREVKVCRDKGYTLLGVGLDTDSPKQYGLETVVVTEPRDIVAVIRSLEAKLANV